MDEKQKTIVVGLTAVLLTSIIAYFLIAEFKQSYALTTVVEPGTFTEFAKCLSSKEIVMTGTDSCGACQMQKTIFGDAFEFVDYRDCYKDSGYCKEQGIEYFPTWIKADEKIVGVQSIEQLEALSGCNA